MQAVDIRVISLTHAEGRRAAAAAQLDPTGLDWSFNDAVDGSLLESVPQYARSKRLRRKGYDLSLREIGCFLSHRSVWKETVAISRPILALEDDFQLACDLPAVLDTVPGFLDQCGFLRLHGFSDQRRRRLAELGPYQLVKFYKDPSGCVGYIVTPDGARALLRNSETFWMTVDNFIRQSWMHRVPIMALWPYPIATSEHHSTSTISDRVELKLPAHRKLLGQINRLPATIAANAYRSWSFWLK